MTIIAILASVGLIYFVLEPLSSTVPADDSNATRREDSEARLEATLREIIDLEADFASGKMAREDYERARSEAEKKAARDITSR